MKKELSETEKALIEERISGCELLQNRQTLRSILTNLFKHQWKGNWAFYELQNRWDFIGDYAEGDFGNQIE